MADAPKRMEEDAPAALIFDLGRVMLDFDHWRAVERVARCARMGKEEIFDFFFDSGLTGLFEEGRISPRDFFLQVKEALGLEMDYADFVVIWNEIFFLSENNRQVHRLTQALKARYRLALVSNINVLHFEYIQKHFSFLGVFDCLVTSYEAKARKPDPRIYGQTLQELGLPAGRVLYTDDRPELVEAARLLGIRGFVFTSAAQLVSDLRSQGVVVS